MIGGNHARDFAADPPISYAIANAWAEFAETVRPSIGGATYVTGDSNLLSASALSNWR